MTAAPLLAPMVDYAIATAKHLGPIILVHNPIFTSTGVMCDCRAGYGCKSVGKHPIGDNWQDGATADPVRIRHRFEMYPHANFGVPTGLLFGKVVLDADGAEGVATIFELERTLGPLPPTVTSLTPSGGQHRFFAHDGAAIHNSVKIVGPMLDVRGEGGQVVAAPSLHQKNKRYQWIQSPLHVGLARLPAAWIDALLGAAAQHASSAKSGTSTTRPTSSWVGSPTTSREVRALLMAMLEHPIIEWMCARPDEVKREVWRGVAVNIAAAVVGHPDIIDLAREIFRGISEDYVGFDVVDCDRVFQGAFDSLGKVAPMRFDTMIAAGAPPEVCVGGTTLIHASRRMIGR